MLTLNLPSIDLSCYAWFSLEDVLLKLPAQRGVNSVGLDSILGDFIYQLRQVIAFSLWLLFRRFINEGIFPEIRKISNITPIFKSGAISDIKNYRPIIILSLILRTL